MSIRPYQKDLIHEVRAEYARGARAVCMQLPTGGGKTVIAGALTGLLVNKMAGHKSIALYLVHRHELILQVTNTLQAAGMEHLTGVIVADRPVTPWAPLQVASIQTLARRLDKLPWLQPKMLFIDECHHARAKSWEKVIKHFASVPRLGMTATPARLDGKGLRSLFDALVCGPTVKDLQAEGYLAPIETYSLPVGLDLEGVQTRMGDYTKTQVDRRVSEKVIAGGVSNYMRHAQGRRTIHYAVTRRHSERFVAGLKEHGVKAEHVDGETPKAHRAAIFRRFQEGRTDCVSNVELITEGFDCPEADCIMLGRPTQSETLYRQMVGRGMRPKADGRAGLILDLASNVYLHGLPESDVEWSLDDGVEPKSVAKAVVYKRTCKHCGFTSSKMFVKCPKCGEGYLTKDVQEVDVELFKVDEDVPTKKKTGPTRWQLSKEIRATKGDAEKLQQLRTKHGYAPGWIRKMRKIYGPIYGWKS